MSEYHIVVKIESQPDCRLPLSNNLTEKQMIDATYNVAAKHGKSTRVFLQITTSNGKVGYINKNGLRDEIGEAY